MNSSDTGERSVIDGEHLRVLAICHFVAAGLAFIALAFSLLYFVMIHAMFDNPEMWAKSPQGPPPVAVVGFFRLFVGVFVLWFLVSAVGNVLSGLFLRARRHRIFSMVIAGLNCLHIPLGTALGIFTIIVLERPSVHQLYEAQLRIRAGGDETTRS